MVNARLLIMVSIQILQDTIYLISHFLPALFAAILFHHLFIIFGQSSFLFQQYLYTMLARLVGNDDASSLMIKTRLIAAWVVKDIVLLLLGIS